MEEVQRRVVVLVQEVVEVVLELDFVEIVVVVFCDFHFCVFEIFE